MPSLTRREFFVTGLCSAFAASTVGCGTVLHPERRGQAAGPLDWKIVALDAIGLLFFFVPGVVAFAVDFSNGTIYLPSESYGKADAQPNSPELREVSIPSAELSQSRIQDVVTEHVGREVQLSPGEYETRELQNIGEFWETNQSLAAL
jgi:hypothetical protein